MNLIWLRFWGLKFLSEKTSDDFSMHNFFFRYQSNPSLLFSNFYPSISTFEGPPAPFPLTPASCVPKKITWNFASMAEALRDSQHYGFATPSNIPFDFASFKAKRDADILGLNRAYERNWSREGITLVHGTAKFLSPRLLSVTLEDGSGEAQFTAPHICIATGGYPIVPKEIPGAEYGITNEGFFALDTLPKKLAVVGAGYIAVEMAGMLNAVGVEVHMFIRGEKFLRSFDPMVQETMTKRYEDVGVKIHRGYKGFERVEKVSDGKGEEKVLKLVLKDGSELLVNELLWAVGRKPETESLDFEKAGVKLNEKGYVAADQYQNTSAEGIYALGDVTGQLELTPGSYLSLIPRQNFLTRNQLP
jgi:glutathione reductase (NADPH)